MNYFDINNVNELAGVIFGFVFFLVIIFWFRDILISLFYLFLKDIK
jgi:hypothetical protein